VCSKETDYRPNRLEAAKAAVERFMREYFDQNPISQVSLALTRDRVAEKLTDLSGNPKTHVEMLRRISRATGAASLQNLLLLAIATLKHVPQYGSREILIVYSSMTSCDAGDIFSTIEEVKKVKIKCSVICLSAEVYICRRLAEETGGNFSVALDMLHFTELLMQHTTPLPEKKLKSNKVSLKRDARGKAVTNGPEADEEGENYTEFIYMGFPSRTFDTFPMLAYDGTGEVVVTSTSYLCPRCGARVAEIPTKCSVCSLQLNSSSHIARSHHHLFPVPLFIESSLENTTNDKDSLNCNEDKKAITLDNKTPKAAICYGCQEVLTQEIGSDSGGIKNTAGQVSGNNGGNKMTLKCPRCQNIFCVECDIFIHDSLHNCPGCYLD